MSLGQKIRELRVAKGLTQSDLGNGLVTPSMISQIESDKANPSYKVLEAIAEKLETPLEHFLSDVQTQLEQTSAHKVAKALLASSNFERAATLLESLLEKPAPNLNQIDVNFDLGDCYLAMKRYDDAISLFERVIELGINKGIPTASLQGLLKLGLIAKERRKYHMAIFHWRKAYEQFDQLSQPEPFLQSQILTHLGEVHNQLGEFEEALEYFGMAYQFLSSSSHFEQIGFTYIGLGLSYKKMREYEKATEYSQYAIAIFESLKNIKLSIDVKKNYGLLKGEEGQVTEALRIFRQCLDEYNRHGYTNEGAAVRAEIARMHLRAGEYLDGKNECTLALRDLPERAKEAAPVLRTLGLIEDKLGDTDAAVKALEGSTQIYRAYDQLAELAETWSMLGDLYQKRGEYSRANECLQYMKQCLTDNLKMRGIIL